MHHKIRYDEKFIFYYKIFLELKASLRNHPVTESTRY